MAGNGSGRTDEERSAQSDTPPGREGGSGWGMRIGRYNPSQETNMTTINLPFLAVDKWSDKDGNRTGNRKVSGTNEKFSFEYGAMYNAPPLGYAQLRALAEHFGTEKIDTESFSRGGCETCDHGSDYGHEIIVEGATKNLPFGE
jgi:hypothetical protein